MAQIIQIKRATTESLLSGKNNLALGEFGFALDNKKLYIGTNDGNVLLNDEIAHSGEAEKLTTARNISLSQDATGSVSFDGSQDVDIVVTLADSGVSAGTFTKARCDSKGRVIEVLTLELSDLQAVSGIGDIITHNASEFENTGAAETVKTELIGSNDDIGSENTIYGAKKYADEQIAAKIASTYKAAGSIEFASLPVLSATEEGKVYNVTDEFTTTENFIEGAGKKYPSGTNIVCIDTGVDEYKWDVLTGFVDLSGYDTSIQVSDKIEAAKIELIGEGEDITSNTIKGAVTEAKTYADSLNTAMNSRVDALESEKHTHTNKEVLDGISSEKVTAWDKIIVDAITTITPGNGVEVGAKSDNTVTISAKVVSVNGLSVDTNGIAINQASTENFGTVKVDGVTMTAVGGVISVLSIDGGEIIE